MWHWAQVEAYTSLPDAHTDLIVLCVKAYDVAETVAPLSRISAPVVTMQNGWGSEALLIAALGDQRVIAGTLTTAVALVDTTHVVAQREQGGVGLASVAQRNSAFAHVLDAFRAAPHLRARAFADWRAMKWSKLLFNLAGNATSAVFEIPYRDVLRDPLAARLEVQALREAERVMRAQGLRAVNLPGAPGALFAFAVRALPEAALRLVLMRWLAGARGDKFPSLYYDVRERRARSEVDVLNGAVAQVAQQLGLAAPVNAALAEAVHMGCAGASREARRAFLHETLRKLNHERRAPHPPPQRVSSH
ncbi:MAG: hypothetical protein N2545_00970, partial [Thermoflexales bacterium]|nr:hypothetical protein [Thermoflexales bacterium]